MEYFDYEVEIFDCFHQWYFQQIYRAKDCYHARQLARMDYAKGYTIKNAVRY